jgi:hypothetical protein
MADSRLKLSAEEEAHLITLDHYGMASYLHELEVSRGYRVADELNPSVLHEITPVEAEPVKQISMTIDGVAVVGTQAEIDIAMKAAFLKNAQHTPQATDDAPLRDAATGRFARQDAQPSTTNAADKITNSLVTRALQEELGISAEELQASVAQIREGNQIVTGWAAATQEFLKSAPDYPGGDELQQRMAARLIELGLAEKPSAASIRKAYDSIAAEAEQYLKLQKATSPDEIAEILGVNSRRVSAQQSAMWSKS